MPRPRRGAYRDAAHRLASAPAALGLSSAGVAPAPQPYPPVALRGPVHVRLRRRAAGQPRLDVVAPERFPGAGPVQPAAAAGAFAYRRAAVGGELRDLRRGLLVARAQPRFAPPLDGEAARPAGPHRNRHRDRLVFAEWLVRTAYDGGVRGAAVAL